MLSRRTSGDKAKEAEESSAKNKTLHVGDAGTHQGLEKLQTQTTKSQLAAGQKSQTYGQKKQDNLRQKIKSSQEGQRVTSQQTGQVQQKADGQQAAGDTARRKGQKVQEISGPNKPGAQKGTKRELSQQQTVNGNTIGLRKQLDTGQQDQRQDVASSIMKGQTNRQGMQNRQLRISLPEDRSAKKGLRKGAQATGELGQQSPRQKSPKLSKKDLETKKATTKAKGDKESVSSTAKDSVTTNGKHLNIRSGRASGKLSPKDRNSQSVKNLKGTSFRRSNRASPNQTDGKPVLKGIMKRIGVAFTKPLVFDEQTSVSSTDQHQYTRSERRRKRAAFACAQQHLAPHGPVIPCCFLNGHSPPC